MALQGISRKRYKEKKAMEELKVAYKNGTVIKNQGVKGQAGFLKEKLIASLENRIRNEPLGYAKRMELKGKIQLLKVSGRMKKIVKPDWFMNGSKVLKRKDTIALYTTKKVVYAKGILTQSGKIIAKIPPVISAGVGAGIATFAFDAGTATYGFISGETFKPEFERKLADAAMTGSAVGAGTGIAIILGATPVGWVVAGIGIAGYFITDLAVQTWHKSQDRKYLTPEDLAFFGIEAKDTIPLNVGNWKKNKSLNLGHWKD